ncbi:MAG: hypothetical protein ACTSR7_20015 [Promethearchaeota archaeon]
MDLKLNKQLFQFFFNFIFEDLLIVGAQPYGIFKKVIDKILDEKSKENLMI